MYVFLLNSAEPFAYVRVFFNYLFQILVIIFCEVIIICKFFFNFAGPFACISV